MLGIAVAGCETPPPTLHQTAPVAAIVRQPAPEPVAAPPRELGDFHITFYYMIAEHEAERLKARNHEAAHAGLEAAVAIAPTDPAAELAVVEPPPPAPALVTLYNGRDCAPLADVTEKFADHLRLQGTGKLNDGRVINVWGTCECGTSPCYQVTDRQWGSGGSGRALEPFRSMAVDPRQVKLGSLLYIPDLDGMTMPGRPPIGGFVHDGCVAADDTGGKIDGNQLDWFVGRRTYFLGLVRRRGIHSWAKHVQVFDGATRCERRDGRVVRVDGSQSI